MTPSTSRHIARHLQHYARLCPDRRALVFPVGEKAKRPVFEELTYAELDQKTDALAHGFQDAGFQRGMKTILMVKPGPELFTILLALFKVGAVPVVVDPGMGLKRMLHCYREVGAEAFVGIPVADVVRTFALSSVRLSVTVGRSPLPSGTTLQALAKRGATKGAFAPEEPKAEDLVMINFTTGSTGPAKGVEYTHAMLDAMLCQIRKAYSLKPGDVGLVTLPLFAIVDMLSGCTSVLAPMDPTRPAKASPRDIVETIERFSIQHLFASPALIHRVCDYAQKHQGALGSLKTVVSGGAAAPIRVLKMFRKALPADALLHTTYGATEALPIASIELEQIVQTAEARTSQGQGVCVGRPLSQVNVRIMHVTDAATKWHPDASVASGQVGEVLVSGPVVSQRYHQNTDANAQLKIEDGPVVWHRTGDLGSLDDEGKLWFCGRKSERVTPETGPLYTVACEGIFNQHPAVYRTALVGVGPSGRQIPVVCIETRKDQSQDLQSLTSELRALAKAHSSTQAIKDFVFHPEFPVDIRHNAKINRAELATWAGAQLELIDIPRAPTWVRLVPLGGWAYLALGPLLSMTHPVAAALWWTDLVLSAGVHSAQLPLAWRAGQRVGHSRAHVARQTLLFGATYWKPLASADAGALK